MKATPLFLLALLAGCAPPQQQPQAARVDSLLISPANGRVARGESLRYVATALLSTGEVRDVTDETVWTVDDVFVGNAPRGSSVVQGLNPGRTVVRAQYGGVMNTQPLDVGLPQYRALRLEPSRPVVPLGLQLPLKLVAIGSDGIEVDVTDEASWTLSTTGLASVRAGTITPLRRGEVTVEMTAKDLSLTAQLVVTDAVIARVDVSASQPGVPAGFTQPLTALATLTDGAKLDVTRVARWAVGDAQRGHVDGLGVFTARQPGAVRVTATAGTITGDTTLLVTDALPMALDVDAQARRFPAGVTTVLRALVRMSDGTQRDVTSSATFTSDDPDRLVVTGHHARGVSPGTALVKATLGALETTTSLEVLDAVLNHLSLRPLRQLPLGAAWQAQALAHWSDGSVSDVTRSTGWLMADARVATVNAEGLVVAQQLGATRLVAHFGGQTQTVGFRVTPAALAEVTVTPSPLRLVRGASARLEVTARWTDGTTLALAPQSCTWVAPTVGPLTVTSEAVVTARSPGNGRVVATCLGARRTIPVTVPDELVVALGLTPMNPSAPVGFGKHLALVAELSDGTRHDVTFSAQWHTDAPRIAVASPGLVSALAPGVTRLSASFGGQRLEVDFVVTSAALMSLELSPETAEVTTGAHVTLRALGRFSDGSTRDVSDEVTWASSDEALATVLGGEVHGLAAGAVTITATSHGVAASAALDVVAPRITRLELSPSSLSLPRGRSASPTLTAVMSDGSVQPVSAQWASSAVDVATVDGAGRVSALAVGHAVITAQVGRFSAAMTVTVTGATPTALTVEAAELLLAPWSVTHARAFATYSDGSRFEVTDEAVWAVANPQVLSVGAPGELYSLLDGTSAVTASWSGLTAHLTFTVAGAPVLLELTLWGPEFIALGDAPSFTAWGEYSDGSTRDVSALVDWSTSDAGVLSVTAGVFTTVAPGVATVTATLEGQSVTYDATVH